MSKRLDPSGLAGAFARDLRSFAAGQTIRARPVGALERVTQKDLPRNLEVRAG